MAVGAPRYPDSDGECDDERIAGCPVVTVTSVPQSLLESVALLGGSTSGIGLECAARLAEAGCRRGVINGRDPERAKGAASHIRQRAPKAEVCVALGDTALPASARAVTTAVLEAFGRIDILVNAASGSDLTARPFQDISPEAVDGVFAAHFKTAFNLCHAVYP